MSDIKHEREFQERTEKVDQQAVQEMAERYARVFLGSPDGIAVLRDLRRRCKLKAPVFEKNSQGRYDYLDAAVRDGARQHQAHIEGALYLARKEHPEVKSEAI